MFNRVRAVAVAAALAALPAIASAQDRQFDVGTKYLNLGVLLGDEAYGSFGAGGGLEVGFKNISDQVILGIGGSVGFRRSSEDFLGYSSSWTVVPVLGFVHGHYQVVSVPKLDLYAGPALGVAIRRYSYDCGTVPNCGDSDNDSDVSMGVQAGARWALTPKVLGWGQLSAGNNLPFLSVGVSFKF
jgi:hypothetical protein